jgi:hypothetical protein
MMSTAPRPAAVNTTIRARQTCFCLAEARPKRGVNRASLFAAATSPD